MKFLYPKAFIVFLLVFVSTTVSAQQLWKEEKASSQNEYADRNKKALPDNYKFFTLNSSVLQSKMRSVQNESQRGLPTTELQLPLPDGSILDADVYESSILSPATQALIPNVKTYMLVDKISQSSRGRITITPNGIAGLIFTGKGSVYINPINEGANSTHIVYYTKELHIPESILCGVKDDAVSPSAGRQNLANRQQAGDCQLRTYKLAVAATGEYTTWAGSQANALTYITICVNAVNAIYERDVTIRFTLVTNNNILYTNAATDPYSEAAGTLTGASLDENQLGTDLNLGVAYDVGIVLNYGWSGGLAQLNSVCTASKARSAAGITFGTGANPTPGPQGSAFDGTVAHEIGHQFSVTHTMRASNGGCSGNVTPATAYEPGGGSTIMAYAGTCTGNYYQFNSDLYFHAGSIAQLASYATNGTGNTCPVTTALSNVAPTVSVASASYTIPVSTPFLLTCSASDANANSLTYTWEQMDAAAASTLAPSATNTTGPNFRSFPPSGVPTRYLPNLPAVVSGVAQPYEVLPSVTRTMNFRVNVRDNAAGGGCNAQENIAVTTNATAGPFTVTSQSSATSLTANGTNTFTITWNVANTNIAPVNCSNVDILFSADGGANFNYVLLTNTANDGTQTITVPNIPTSSGRIMIRSVGNIFFNVNTATITISSGCGAEGATLTPSATVNASAGSAALNLSSAPNFGTIVNPSGTLQSTDPISSVAFYNSVTSSCITANNYQYDSYSFQVNIAGTYIFTKSAGNIVTNLYTGSYTPGTPCLNFINSNSVYDGSTVNIGSSVSASLVPGVIYTLTVGTFNSGNPPVPFAYTVTVSGPGGGNIYTGYPNPGASFSYRYVIVENSTGNIKAISTTPNLSNSTTYPVGTYTVYGFSYLTTDFTVGTLNGYVGGSFLTFTNDLANNPSTRCGNISKNSVTVNVLVILPIKLLPLTGVWEGNKVRLFWSTESETNSKNFEIERSADGVSFNLLKTKDASINSSARSNYSILDDAPFADKGFYRIKAFDADGKYVYSNIALVKKAFKGFDIKIYPNPVTDKSTIEILASENKTVSIEIVNTGGSVISRKATILKKGINVETIDMEKLSGGVYYIKIISDTDIITEKLIKM